MRGPPRGSPVAAVVLALLAGTFAVAQGPPPDASPGLELQRPGERPLPRPDFGEPGPVLPGAPGPVPSPPPGPAPAGAEPTVVLRAIVFRGNTVLDDAALASAAAPWLDRPVTTEDLDALRVAVTRLYVDRGYINSGAVIPDQRVSDGTLAIDIVEGRLSEIRIQGTTTLRDGYLRERIELAADGPLNIDDLQEQLQIQAQSPLLERLNADLQPGDRPGEARLAVDVAERRPYRLGLQVDNDVSPDLGPVRGKAVGVLLNPTGWGDVLSGEVEFGRGLHGFALSYSRPLTARDTTLAVYGERTDSVIVEEPLDVLDVESESTTVGVRLSHPVYRTSRAQLLLGVAFERRRSQTFLLGRGFPFSDGVEPDGESRVSVFRLSQDWVQRSRDQVFAARSTFSVGVDAFDATMNRGKVADASFVAWLGQAQWARRFGEDDYELLARLDGQLTDDPLLPLEQFSIGGASSVRGYRSNLLVRDWGYSASLELRIPVHRDEGGRITLRFAPFLDLGGGWQRDRPTPRVRRLASVGAGLRWDPDPRLHAELYLGIPLRKVDVANEGLQDAGLHFALTAAVFD